MSPLLQADRCARCADFGQPGAQRRLSGDEGRTARRTAVFGVVVREDHAFVGDPVDVRRLVAHHAARIRTDIRLADVVAENHEDVGFSRVFRGRLRCGRRRGFGRTLSLGRRVDRRKDQRTECGKGDCCRPRHIAPLSQEHFHCVAPMELLSVHPLRVPCAPGLPRSGRNPPAARALPRPLTASERGRWFASHPSC